MPEARPNLRERLLRLLLPYAITLAVALPLALFYFLRLRELRVRWAAREGLLLLLAVPLCAWASFHLERRRAASMVFSRLHDLAAMRPGWVARVMHLPQALRLVAIALLALALARPQERGVNREEVEGIDIVIVLDVSDSMREMDLLPSRIDAAKRVLDEFIAQRDGDRVGLVLFGARAVVQSPLTLDTAMVRHLLGTVKLGMKGVDGSATAIGDGIGTAVNRLAEPDCDQKIDPAERRKCKQRAQEIKNRTKIIVLVTDGDDNASRLDPHEAADAAHDEGIRVFTVLIGRDVVPQPPGVDRYGNLIVGSRPAYPVNPKLLEEIAGKTGGVPYLASDGDALQTRIRAIGDDLTKNKYKSQRVEWRELYPLFVAPAIALVLLELVLLLTRLRRFP